MKYLYPKASSIRLYSLRFCHMTSNFFLLDGRAIEISITGGALCSLSALISFFIWYPLREDSLSYIGAVASRLLVTLMVLFWYRPMLYPSVEELRLVELSLSGWSSSDFALGIESSAESIDSRSSSRISSSKVGLSFGGLVSVF